MRFIVPMENVGRKKVSRIIILGERRGIDFPNLVKNLLLADKSTYVY